jgi:ParB family transcriptional regulator, chromosome partitioning protein
MADKRPALGKGLSALIPEAPEPRSGIVELDLDRLEPNRLQPRTRFQPAGIEDLAKSIRANGIIQPIIVRKVGANYQIIAGERRWRAAQQAGLLKVPVVIKDVGEGKDADILEMALIENIQREDLNSIETALAYRRLSDEFGLTQEEIAQKVGRDRATIANTLRLLGLPGSVREQVANGALSMGHARALLGLESPAIIEKSAAEVLAKRLSVRETEALVKRVLKGPRSLGNVRDEKADVHTRAAEQDLRLSLGAPVRIVRAKKGGRIEIEFKNEDELQRLFETLTAQ